MIKKLDCDNNLQIYKNPRSNWQ